MGNANTPPSATRRSEKQPCPNHPNEPKLGYLEAHADADRRIKRREQQWRCGRCGLWVWAEFMVDMSGAMTESWWRRLERDRKRKEKANAR